MFMSEKDQKEKRSPLQWVIRSLVLLIFVVALLTATVRLLEWNRDRLLLREEEERKNRLQEEIGDLEDELGRPVDEEYVKDHIDD
jgi:hypothetical protein